MKTYKQFKSELEEAKVTLTFQSGDDFDRITGSIDNKYRQKVKTKANGNSDITYTASQKIITDIKKMVNSEPRVVVEFNLHETPFVMRQNAKVHFVTKEGKNGKFASVACGIKAGRKVFSATMESGDVTCAKCITHLKHEGIIEEEPISTAQKQRDNYLNKFIEQLGEGDYKDDEEDVDEEAANNAGGGGVAGFKPGEAGVKVPVRRRKKKEQP